MLKELRAASESYIVFVEKFNELMEECDSLEFIAINSGIASKQANSNSFMKLSNEIQTLSKNITQSASLGQDIAYSSLERSSATFGQLLINLKHFRLVEKASENSKIISLIKNKIIEELEEFDLREIKRDLGKMSRAVDTLISLVSIGKTIAVGGKIRAVYIYGNEEKFKIITETMGKTISKIFDLLDEIIEQLDFLKTVFQRISRDDIDLASDKTFIPTKTQG